MTSSSESESNRGSFAGPSVELDLPREWDRLVEAVGPASMLVVIERRMGPKLREKAHAEDVWQETLLHAWRDRADCRFTGVAGFRRWLLGIVDHRIADLRDFFNAKKRASHLERPWNWASQDGGGLTHEPLRTTTPSRLAIHREQADQMVRALDSVDHALRDVVRLRLFEGCTMPEVAAQLGLGLSAAKHRYRRGAAQYRAQLFRRLGSMVESKDQIS